MVMSLGVRMAPPRRPAGAACMGGWLAQGELTYGIREAQSELTMACSVYLSLNPGFKVEGQKPNQCVREGAERAGAA